MGNYFILNPHKRDMSFRKIDKKSIAFLLVFVLIFSMLFAMTSMPVTYAADDHIVRGGDGGGGGGGGAAEGSFDFGLGGAGGGADNGGGNGAHAIVFQDWSGGGGGGGGGDTGNVFTAGGDANYITGGAAGIGGGATAGGNGSFGTMFIGGAGGNGGNGRHLSGLIYDGSESIYSNIIVESGSGGSGGQQVIGTNDRLSGPGGNGGNGGDAELQINALKVTALTKIFVKSGFNGLAGNGDGEQNGSGGTAGDAVLGIDTVVNTPILTVEKNDGGMDVDIHTLNVTSNTSITAKGTSADEFVITNVNVSSGGILTIDNTEGNLSIGTLNIAEGGKVIVTNPTPNAADPARIVGDETFKLKKGYKTTYSKAFTISGFPEATISIDNDYDGKIIWNHDVNKFYISEGLDIGSYPINITVSNGVNEESSMQFTVIVGENLTPTNNNSPTDQTDGKNPQTNDNSELLLWVIIECMVLMGIGLYVWQARRRINI